jgi:hypothetical protein
MTKTEQTVKATSRYTLDPDRDICTLGDGCLCMTTNGRDVQGTVIQLWDAGRNLTEIAMAIAPNTRQWVCRANDSGILTEQENPAFISIVDRCRRYLTESGRIANE